MRECENWEMWKCGNYRREMRHGIAKYGNCIRSLSEVEGSHFHISQFSHFFLIQIVEIQLFDGYPDGLVDGHL